MIYGSWRATAGDSFPLYGIQLLKPDFDFFSKCRGRERAISHLLTLWGIFPSKEGPLFVAI